MNAIQKAQFEAWYATVAQSTGGNRAAMELAWQAALASQAEAAIGLGDQYIVHGDKRSIQKVRDMLHELEGHKRVREGLAVYHGGEID